MRKKTARLDCLEGYRLLDLLTETESVNVSIYTKIDGRKKYAVKREDIDEYNNYLNEVHIAKKMNSFGIGPKIYASCVSGDGKQSIIIMDLWDRALEIGEEVPDYYIRQL